MKGYSSYEEQEEPYRFHILNTLLLVGFAFGWLCLLPGQGDAAGDSDRSMMWVSVGAWYVGSAVLAAGAALLAFKLRGRSTSAANMVFGAVFLLAMSYGSYDLVARGSTVNNGLVTAGSNDTSTDASPDASTEASSHANLTPQSQDSQDAVVPAETSGQAAKVRLPHSDERKLIVAEVRKLTADGNFAKLELMAKTMRTNDERTRDGWAKLTSFYDGTNSGLLAIEEIYGSKIAQEQLEEWKTAYPDSVTPLVAQANFQVKQAWAARTGTYAKDVRPEQWAVFAEKLKQVIATLEQIREMDEFDPDAHALWFTVAAASGFPREQMEELLLEGIKEYPTSEELYRGMAFYLLPQWQGAPGDLEKYADDVREALSAPLDDIMYARIIGFAYNYHKGELFNKTTFTYDKAYTALQTLITEYPDGVVAKKLLCRLAVAASDRETAKLMFDEIGEWGDEELRDYWTSRAQLKQFQAWAREEGSDPTGISPLEKALARGSLSDVKKLVEDGADVNGYLSDGKTPLMRALKNRKSDIVTYLVENKADLKGKGRSGYSVAAQAVAADNVEVVELILKIGIGINDEVSPGGWTMLHIAATEDSAKVARLLLGIPEVDVNARSESGVTPLYIAAEENSAQCAKILIDHGADVNAANRDRITPLHIAAYTGSAEVIEHLLKGGADRSAKTQAGVTPLQTAERRHKRKAVELLREEGK